MIGKTIFGKLELVEHSAEGALTRVEAGLCKTEQTVTRYYTDAELLSAKAQLQSDKAKQISLGLTAEAAATQAKIDEINGVL